MTSVSYFIVTEFVSVGHVAFYCFYLLDVDPDKELSPFPPDILPHLTHKEDVWTIFLLENWG